MICRVWHVRTSPMCWDELVWCRSLGRNILLVKECWSSRPTADEKISVGRWYWDPVSISEAVGDAVGSCLNLFENRYNCFSFHGTQQWLAGWLRSCAWLLDILDDPRFQVFSQQSEEHRVLHIGLGWSSPTWNNLTAWTDSLQVSSSEVTDGTWYMRNRQSFENEAGWTGARQHTGGVW